MERVKTIRCVGKGYSLFKVDPTVNAIGLKKAFPASGVAKAQGIAKRLKLNPKLLLLGVAAGLLTTLMSKRLLPISAVPGEAYRRRRDVLNQAGIKESRFKSLFKGMNQIGEDMRPIDWEKDRNR